MKIIRRLLIFFLLGLVFPQFGTLLNDNTMDKNHDKMPVWCINYNACNFGDDKEHVAIGSDTREILTSDIFPVYYVSRHSIGIYGLASIGDFFIWTGESLMVFVPIAFLLYLIFIFVKCVGICVIEMFKPGW